MFLPIPYFSELFSFILSLKQNFLFTVSKKRGKPQSKVLDVNVTLDLIHDSLFKFVQFLVKFSLKLHNLCLTF